MCNKKGASVANKSLIYLNTPITSCSEDVIGFSTHVEKLATAIEGGAQMIALTSPFGAGKSSIIELLQGKYKEDPNKQIIKISMWSHLPSSETAELHKGFVYQLISQIDYRKGRYMSRLLNPSFGLLKLQTDKPRYWGYVVVALVLFLLGYVFPEILKISLPFDIAKSDSAKWLMVFVSVLLFTIAVTRGEIVFSSNKSEGGRKIDANEIMRLYRSEVLGVLKYNPNHCRKGIHYIVVIEDLDRTNDSNAVVNFLKELRKYYIPDCTLNQNNQYKNKVTFLINVKPETQLCSKSYNSGEHERLYAKLFDYILNLQTINIDDYETVLEGLLSQKADELHQLGFTWENKIVDIPGMKWIIRGSHMGIREIKDRLNIAFALYESLKQKFGEQIEFEKCAIVAYLTTEFEKAFHATDDHAFQNLVYAYLRNDLSDAKIDEILPDTDSDYKKEVQELIAAKKIDNNYRIYFYNYPKDGSVLSVDEAIVQHAILYGEGSKTLQTSVEKVLQSGSTIIRSAFQGREQLGLLLPNLVFKNEALYTQSLKYAFPAVISWVKTLDYSKDAYEKTIEQLRVLLHFDADRIFYSKENAQAFVMVWEENFSETALLQLRKLICKEFPSEAIWYRALFGGVHKLATAEELDYLSLSDAISLTNNKHDSFSVDNVDYLMSRFLEEPDIYNSTDLMREFLESAKEILGTQSILFPLLAYQQKTRKILSDFEKDIIEALLGKAEGSIDKAELFCQYQQLINLTAKGGLSKQTIKCISSLERYSGYSTEVTNQMEDAGYILDYILQSLSCNTHIPFENDNIISTLHKAVQWLLERPQLFILVRNALVKEKVDIIRRYLFMFGDSCPVITQDELEMLYSTPVKDIIAMIPPSLVTDDCIRFLTPYFCQKKQSTGDSMSILNFVSQMEMITSEKMFYSLNFDMIRYRYMSADRKKLVKKNFSEILSLNTPEGKIKFMTATRALDSEWEAQMLDELKSDDELQKKYVAAVENEDSGKPLSKITVQILCSFSTHPLVSERVYQRYFDFKYYKEYVSCRTRARNAFEIETGDRGNLLWPIYVDMFGHNGYDATRKYMGENEEFLEKIMQEGLYKKIMIENLMPLASILQSKECIEYITGLDAEYALKYLINILGFKDKSAAATYVECIEKNLSLLQSEALYESTHEKLLDGTLKAKYTRARTKAGFGKAQQ